MPYGNWSNETDGIPSLAVAAKHVHPANEMNSRKAAAARRRAVFADLKHFLIA